MTHTYATPYTGDVRIMTMYGSIYDELDRFDTRKGHWDLYVEGNGVNATYTTTTWAQIPLSSFRIRPATGHLTQTEVDQLLIDLAATGDAGSATIDLRGNNAAPSAASATAITTLQSLGHTVLTN